METVPGDRCTAAIEIGGSIRQCASRPHPDGSHLVTVELNTMGTDDAVTAVVTWPASDLPENSPLSRAVAG